MSSSDIAEVKAGYSWSHLGLLVIGAFITAAIGYGFNEYTRDRKVLEVMTRSSGNLASQTMAATSRLEMTLETPNGKQLIKSLVRYDVRISNRSEQGADDFNVFLETPKSIELVPEPTITTIPPELRNAVVTHTTRGPAGRYQTTVNLLNPSQSITLGYLGFSETESVTGAAPPNVVVSKKDWTQRNVADEAASDNNNSLWTILSMIGVAILLGNVTTAAIIFYVAARRTIKVVESPSRDSARVAGQALRKVQAPGKPRP
jgi:hypothetical protein